MIKTVYTFVTNSTVLAALEYLAMTIMIIILAMSSKNVLLSSSNHVMHKLIMKNRSLACLTSADNACKLQNDYKMEIRTT